MSVRRFAARTFAGEGGGLLLAGNALHADLTPETVGSAAFGLVLTGLGQTLGFPVPGPYLYFLPFLSSTFLVTASVWAGLVGVFERRR